MFKKVILLFVFIAFISCKTEKPREINSMAKEGIVNRVVTDATLLNIPSTFKILSNQGVKGVIVFNTGATGVLKFRAFDLGCPYINPASCTKRMTVNSSGVMSCKDCIEDEITFNSLTKTNVTINDKTYDLIEYEAIQQGGGIRIRNFRR